uniref:Coiled-coil domain containing 112 n=1 Tax=Mola mola TaxID=94237 RepID=A0A3Q4A8Z3_MOLML
MILFIFPLGMNLQKQLVKIHDGVRKFQRQLMDVKPTPALIERLEEVMSEVETSINTLKGEQRSRFEDLLKEERTCRQEVTAYEKKIENWTNLISTKPPHRDLPAEVRALEAFLQDTGGLCGGWDQYDHQAFLKVWTKHSGQPAYRREAKLYLPGKTAEEIEQHEKWHQELIRLQDKKREVDNRDQTGRGDAAKETGEGCCLFPGLFIDGRAPCPQRLSDFRYKTDFPHQEERRRQLKVKLGIKEQLRLRREEEEERRRREREEEQNGRCLLFVFTQVDSNVGRDPSRLTRLTKGWEERMKHVRPSGAEPVSQMFHRVVPTWRQDYDELQW